MRAGDGDLGDIVVICSVGCRKNGKYCCFYGLLVLSVCRLRFIMVAISMQISWNLHLAWLNFNIHILPDRDDYFAGYFAVHVSPWVLGWKHVAALLLLDLTPKFLLLKIPHKTLIIIKMILRILCYSNSHSWARSTRPIIKSHKYNHYIYGSLLLLVYSRRHEWDLLQHNILNIILKWF